MRSTRTNRFVERINKTLFEELFHVGVRKT